MERALPTSRRMKNVMTVYKKRSAQSGLKDRGCVMNRFQTQGFKFKPQPVLSWSVSGHPWMEGFP